MRTRLMTAPLLRRVFAANAAVMTLAFVGLVVAPVTVSVPVAASGLAVLAVGLVALLVLNLALLRPAFRPLDERLRRCGCTIRSRRAGAHRLAPGLALSPDEELVIYRVAQEALTNVVRHAGATRAQLELRGRDGATTLVVRDDGRGLAPGAPRSANGIRGLRERAMLIGADVAIHGLEGGGTAVRLRIPSTPEPR